MNCSQGQLPVYWRFLSVKVALIEGNWGWGNSLWIFHTVKKIKIRWLLALKKCIVGFISAQKIHGGIYVIFRLRHPCGNTRILREAFGWLHQKPDVRVASSVRKCPRLQIYKASRQNALHWWRTLGDVCTGRCLHVKCFRFESWTFSNVEYLWKVET